ncbi:MAG: NHLP bacteriocin system secretion protein [Pirellulaceae bacterium]
MTDRPLFRREAMQQLASLGETDRLPSVIGLRRWLALAALGGMAVAAVVWSLAAEVPVNVEGAGVMLNPGAVHVIQSHAAGQIVEVRVRRGETMETGDVVVTLAQPELQRQLAEAESRLEELRRLDRLQAELDAQRLQLEQSLSRDRLAAIDEAIGQLTELVGEVDRRRQQLTDVQRQRLTGMREKTQQLIETLARQSGVVRDLAERQLARQESVVAAEAAEVDAALQLANIELQLGELDLKDFTVREQKLDYDSRLSELRLQSKQVGLEQAQLQQQIQRQQGERTLQIEVEQQRVRTIAGQLARQQAIRATAAGRVLEVSAQPGQIVAPGSRLALVSEEPPASDDAQRVVAYLPLESGKQIREGMTALVTPTTIERNRYGSILGRVRRVAAYASSREAAAAAVGNVELLGALSDRGGVLEIEVELERADTPSGYRWTSRGPDTQFTVGTAAAVRVTVERRAPASFLLPWLRGLAFGPQRGPGPSSN